MIPTAQQQAEPALTLTGLEWHRVLDALRARVRTPYGQAALEGMGFFSGAGAARRRMALVAEMQALVAAHGELGFADVYALDALLDRATKHGRLETEELAEVLSTQRAALLVQAGLRSGADLPGLAQLADGLHPERDLVDTLSRAITPTGELNDETFPELARFKAELTERRDAIHERLEGLLRSEKLSRALQDTIYTLRGRRYVLPIKVDFRGALRGIVHDVSASGATLFIEPQSIVDDTNALTLAARQLELEQDRILRTLSEAVGEAAPHLRDNLAWLGRVELLHAQALLCATWQGIVPQVEEEGRIELRGAAHPLMLMEEQLGLHGAPAPKGEGRQRVVRNDVALGGEARCMVVSGANTGGKTVLLKTVGLCALLVRCGMPLPAQEGSRCDLFGQVWADIGDQQSLETDLSTFSARIRFLADLLPRVGPDSLVLLDEILDGTEPTQGAALAAAVLESLLERGPLVLVTTHYSELKVLAEERAGMANASVSFDPERLRPTFRLQPGLPGASYGLHIARRYGLPEAIVAQAEQALADRPAAADALLIRLQEQEQRLARAEEDLRRRQGTLERAEAELARQREGLAERERGVRRRERGEIGEEVRAARRKIAGVIKELQQARSLPVAGRVRHRLAEVEQEIVPPEPEPARGPEPIADLAALAPGAAVYLPSLERRATLEAVLDEGQRARIRMGPLSMEVAAEELSQPPAGIPERPGRGRRRAGERREAAQPTGQSGGAAGPEPDAAPAVPYAVTTADNTLDLRGARLHDAIERSGQFFDRCVVKHVSPVVLIHGHGTGRLKAGLREHLQDSPYVLAFRPGEKGEGGDGVTVVSLLL